MPDRSQYIEGGRTILSAVHTGWYPYRPFLDICDPRREVGGFLMIVVMRSDSPAPIGRFDVIIYPDGWRLLGVSDIDMGDGIRACSNGLLSLTTGDLEYLRSVISESAGV